MSDPLKPCSECGHYWHDINDYDDPLSMCCVMGCPCGKSPALVASEQEIEQQLEALRLAEQEGARSCARAGEQCL